MPTKHKQSIAIVPWCHLAAGPSFAANQRPFMVELLIMDILLKPTFIMVTQHIIIAFEVASIIAFIGFQCSIFIEFVKLTKY
jgi:hypothetical protein